MREKSPYFRHHHHRKEEEGFMALYHKNKVGVICTGVAILLFVIMTIAILVTVSISGFRFL